MANPPEALTLFDIETAPVSDSGTATPLSESRTARPVSESETEAAPTPLRTAKAGDIVAETTAVERAAEAAAKVKTARLELDAAIIAARSDGASWRTISTATGIPYQTLHARHASGSQVVEDQEGAPVLSCPATRAIDDPPEPRG